MPVTACTATVRISIPISLPLQEQQEYRPGLLSALQYRPREMKDFLAYPMLEIDGKRAKAGKEFTFRRKA